MSSNLILDPISCSPFSQFTVFTQEFDVQLADSSHAEKIFKLVNKAYMNEGTRKPNVTRYDTVEEVSNLIEKTQSISWLILQPKGSDKVIGSLQISKQSNERRYLGSFAIDPRYRVFHLGICMLKEAEKFLLSKKVNEVFLDVLFVAKDKLNPDSGWHTTNEVIESESNKLASFYERNGYKYTDVTELPDIGWLNATRKAEYVDKVFFKEMKKDLLQ